MTLVFSSVLETTLGGSRKQRAPRKLRRRRFFPRPLFPPLLLLLVQIISWIFFFFLSWCSAAGSLLGRPNLALRVVKHHANAAAAASSSCVLQLRIHPKKYNYTSLRFPYHMMNGGGEGDDWGQSNKEKEGEEREKGETRDRREKEKKCWKIHSGQKWKGFLRRCFLALFIDAAGMANPAISRR